MGEKYPFYLKYLEETLQSRQNKNPSYSIRAFASSLGFDFSQFSKILRRKSVLSPARADAIAKKLSLDPETRAKFIQSAAEEKMCASLEHIDQSLTDCKKED